MRRERRFNKDRMNIKKVLYISGGIILLSIIAFFAVSILNMGKQSNNQQLAKFNTAILDDYASNSTDVTEQTSSEMGKTINEVQSEDVNDVKEEKEEVSENTVKESNESSTAEKSKNESNSESNNNTKSEEDAISVSPTLVIISPCWIPASAALEPAFTLDTYAPESAPKP